MFHTNLAAILRNAGLAVIEVDGWQTRGYSEGAGDDGGMGRILQIVCHHTAGPANGDYPSLGVVRDGRAGLAGPLAQLGLSRSGVWYVIAAGYANHTGAVRDGCYGNMNSLGIEAENTGRGEPWPDVQYAAYVRGVRALWQAFNIPIGAIMGHKEICAPKGRKVDPTFNMTVFRTAVYNDTYGPAADPLPMPERADYSTGGTTYYPESDYNIDGALGMWTVVALQEFLRDEGYYPESDYWLDGDLGPATIIALQRLLTRWNHYDREIDGQLGEWTVRGLQQFLQGNGYYPAAQYETDGELGPCTIAELQRFLAARPRKN
ncbi:MULTISPECIES: peptidoglycan recognition protein family protein [unclassified Actinotignum]|uniref:peptidoglycan recognition protein family protein n=1 Tax=unclassified Actinotignum TaxID=2632702 RepID=UPI002A801D45|nr:N-acetylmuramoyl-L-alanine amidase [Actinotignum sp. SLA_B059]MDY5127469.1 N-acetylmuramoyl-L-alanine amidase [Actinotignum sp. SLA_B059]